MKTGSSILRWIFVECAQSCRLTPRIIKDLAKRSEGLSPEVKAIAWKAQIRLHRKICKTCFKGQKPFGSRDGSCPRIHGLRLGSSTAG